MTREKGKSLQKHLYVKTQQLNPPLALKHSAKENLIFLQPGGLHWVCLEFYSLQIGHTRSFDSRILSLGAERQQFKEGVE